MTARPAGLWGAMLLVVMPLLAWAGQPTRITPTAASPLATASELVERQFGPLRAFQIQAKLHTLGLEHTSRIKLADERMLVRVPDKTGANGRYGLLVFLDSRPQARYDVEWNNALDSHGLIFVSPDNAGDDAAAFDRRIPLALDAYEYARQTYQLDPDRIYIAGDAGGSLVAHSLAVSYPDVFSGAIVNAGALELGTPALPAPSPELLQRLRTHSRLVFAASSHDEPAFTQQRRTLKSLSAYCAPVGQVFENGHVITGHAVINGLFLNDFIHALDAPPRAGTTDQATCEANLARDARSSLATIRQLDAGGRHDEALKSLVAFDNAYGRLFLDDAVALVKQVNPAFFSTSAAPASDPAPAAAH
ncbi:MAG TPA: PHB depolymerase family esterase [Luteimonas sp.]|nr:PHB depolymerase family esterase [Luteimonas sp.]